MERMLTEMGYKVIAGDTDSNFAIINNRNYQEIEIDLKKIEAYINSKVPFPQPTFTIAIEHILDYIMFVEDEDKKLKKNYIYVYTDKNNEKQVIVKGLPIIKNQATELGKLILQKYIIPRIKAELKGKFDKKWFDDIIATELKENIMLITQEYKCKAVREYESDNNCIWKKISIAYLDSKGGYVKLIKNNKCGRIGDKEKYCSIEEAQKADLKINNLDLSKLYNELAPFMVRKSEKKGGLFDYA
jgi:DNA polymerase elongation subunit (family B)